MKRKPPTIFNNLAGKTIVITGASSGAGRAIALEFARHNCNLVLAARRENALTSLLGECEELGGRAVSVTTDVSDPSSMRGLASAALSFTGRIDVWINNAGVLAIGEIDKTPIEVHEKVIRTNLLGYIYGAAAVVPYFKRQQYGVLINNISVGGYVPTPFAVAYTASKFGVRGYSDALKAELAGWNDIHVCDLYTAFLDTPGVQHAANYTGKVLRPAPPLLDPVKLAQKTAELAMNPHRIRYTDAVTFALRTGYSASPRLARNIASGMFRQYFRNAMHSAETSGNVLAPAEFGSSVHGGWDTPISSRQKIKSGFVAAGLLAGLIILTRSFR